MMVNVHTAEAACLVGTSYNCSVQMLSVCMAVYLSNHDARCSYHSASWSRLSRVPVMYVIH